MNKIEFAGYSSYCTGGLSDENPYREGSREWLMWANGFIAAEAQDARNDERFEYECGDEQ